MTGDGPRREGAIVTGEVIRVPEDSYRFGTGILTLYVTEISAGGRSRARSGSSCAVGS
ncbi:hypothetical protein ABZ793_00220 [Micromonospora sp. NPDC047465]|uniref:hypothetical protein n=1 Tax=Micromonospora sp. NPDC047465 TaxID=3154813 RepID=UPI0034057E23